MWNNKNIEVMIPITGVDRLGGFVYNKATEIQQCDVKKVHINIIQSLNGCSIWWLSGVEPTFEGEYCIMSALYQEIQKKS
jgi:hypothetical protein